DPEWHERLDRDPEWDYDHRGMRHNSDRSEDGYLSDDDYQQQDNKMERGEEESKAIMLRGLSLQIKEEGYIFLTSRGFAFVEFIHIDSIHIFCPDTSAYQYNESSGYYFNPQTVLYYDPNRLLTTTTPRPNSTCTGTVRHKPTSLQRQKPHNSCRLHLRTAQEQNSKRWANRLNKQKESFKRSFQGLGQDRDEDRREAAAANTGFETQLVKNELVKKGEPETPAKSSLVAVYSGDSDPEEAADPDQGVGGDERSDRLTDWRKLACLLCLMQFPSEDALLRHQQLQTCRMQNLEIHRRSKLSEAELEELERCRDRAAERRDKYGVPEPPVPKKTKFYHPQPNKDGLTNDNIGNKMLQAMGWQEGKGQGRNQPCITAPITASLRTKGTRLGIKGSNYELLASDTYKDTVLKAIFAHFIELA
uniref:G-patch domain-containing protein n=1 Tax=Salmo trutta TaxID=8032 RepID=A0A673ZSJ2_SALTR